MLTGNRSRDREKNSRPRLNKNVPLSAELYAFRDLTTILQATRNQNNICMDYLTVRYTIYATFYYGKKNRTKRNNM
jgi:hypothetical protein